MVQPVVRKIPSLNQGISKQSPSLRFPAQVSDAKNIEFSVVDGARKRPGGRTVATMSGAVEAAYRMHKIERDDLEEYAIVFGPANPFLFKIIDLTTGLEASLTRESGVDAYLSASGATVDDLRFTTIADTTFVVNTKKPTGLAPNDSGAIDNSTMPLSLVRTSVQPLQFELKQTEFKPRAFRQQVLTPANPNASVSGNFRLRYAPGGTNYTTPDIPYNATATDVQVALQGDGTSANEGLPPFPFGKVICTGGPLPEKEVFINISTDLDVDRLITVPSQPVGTAYSVTRGSDSRDPAPGFIRQGRPIQDISYFRGRLVIASDEFVVFSRSDDAFAFFLESPLAVADSDPIEIQLAASDVNIVDFVVPFRNTLVILTKSGQQFELSSDGVLSPSTAAVTPSTRYQTQAARPVQIGNRLYMAGDGADHSSLLEYFFQDTFVSNVAVKVSKHIDNLIPPNVTRIASVPTAESVVMLPAIAGDASSGQSISFRDGFGDTDGSDEYDETTTWLNGNAPAVGDDVTITQGHVVTFDGYYDPPGNPPQKQPGIESDVYVYRTYFNGSERSQSAWSKWNFDGDAIMDIASIDQDLFVLRRETAVSTGNVFLKIDRLDMSGSRKAPDTSFNREICMDHMVKKSGTISGNSTTITMSEAESDLDLDTAVDTAGNEYVISQNADGTTITIPVAIGTDVMLGRKIDCEVELTELVMRSPQNEPIEGGRLVIRRLILNHTNSGPYDLTVDSKLPSFVPTRTVSRTATTLESGLLEMGVMGQARDLVVKTKSDNSYPCTITGVEYHATYSTSLE